MRRRPEMKYWKECVEAALEEAGLSATTEQIVTMAEVVEGSHDNFSLCTGAECIPHPMVSENAVLKDALKRELSKRVCPKCKGTGRLYDGDCFRCRGRGFVYS